MEGFTIVLFFNQFLSRNDPPKNVDRSSVVTVFFSTMHRRHTFVSTCQVRENLHVILCFSPMAPEFRNRARKFPALVSCTVIDWFQPWPKEALASVGTRFLAKSNYLDGAGVRAGVEQFMINSFEGVNTMCAKVSLHVLLTRYLIYECLMTVNHGLTSDACSVTSPTVSGN